MKYKGCNKKILESLGLDTSYPKCKCEECNDNNDDKTKGTKIGDWNGNVWG